jgi:predicted TIM-barrel fold metal-dependent hydrolase
MRVVDADAHVEEGVGHWEYLEPEFYARRPVPITFPTDTAWGEHNGGWLIDYKLRKFASSPTSMARAQRRAFVVPSQEISDVAMRLADMDRCGIEKQVLYPSTWLGCLAEDVTLEAALCRSYNTYMATQCNQSGGRLFYAAVLPFRDPAASAAEVRRVKTLGSAVSIFIRGMEWDIPITHPMFRPIYQEAERQELVMGLHIGFGSPTINRMFEGMPRPQPDPFPHIHPLARGMLSGMLVQQATQGLLSSTLLEDFPTLRWAILEAGAEWVVPTVRALKHRSKREGERYFRAGRIYVSCEPYEDLPWLIQNLGEDCFVIASDMPHEDDFAHEHPAEAFRDKWDLAEPTLEKLVGANAGRLYRI